MEEVFFYVLNGKQKYDCVNHNEIDEIIKSFDHTVGGLEDLEDVIMEKHDRELEGALKNILDIEKTDSLIAFIDEFICDLNNYKEAVFMADVFGATHCIRGLSYKSNKFEHIYFKKETRTIQGA